MSANVNWSNPYENQEGDWYKGNLHTHTSPASGCGTMSVADVLRAYARARYDFLAISDHKVLTEATHRKISFIPGVEWNSAKGEHTGIYSLDTDLLRAAIVLEDHDELLDFLTRREALVVLNHPNWEVVPHYTLEQLLNKAPYDGIEIYNGVINRLPGGAISTDKWDHLLSSHRRVLGFASDDSHLRDDIGQAAIWVRAKSRKPEDLLAAIRRGNFYCSSGVRIQRIQRRGDVIEIASPDAEEIHVVGAYGRVLRRLRRKRAVVRVSDLDSIYVRFTLYGWGASMAWTQPFFLAE